MTKEHIATMIEENNSFFAIRGSALETFRKKLPYFTVIPQVGEANHFCMVRYVTAMAYARINAPKLKTTAFNIIYLNKYNEAENNEKIFNGEEIPRDEKLGRLLDVLIGMFQCNL
jgi:hypothetical protein